MIIYKAQNKINGKIYIGLTNRSIDERVHEHWLRPKHPFGLALRKYGIQSFDISTIDSALLKEIAYEKEKYWIKFYNSKASNGYNLTDGGDGITGHKGYHFSEETKKKMSESFKGRIISKEQREKISESLMGRPGARKGKHASEETRKKMSEARIGKPGPFKGEHRLEETRKKISQSLKGRHLSEERRKEMSESRKGKPHPYKGKPRGHYKKND